MAIVKSVTSGDSLILRGRAVSGPPPEKSVSLSLISAPRKDQKFYIESKDFTRKLIIGKNVEFQPFNSLASKYKDGLSREIGNVLLQGENIAKIIVKNGWANVKTSNDLQELNDLHKELLELETLAKLEKIGIFSQNLIPVNVSNTIQEDLKVFLDKYKNIEIPGVIEVVKDASTFRVLLTLDGSKVLITLGLAGVKTPVLRRGIPNLQDLVEPFAEEAKFMVESRLGQRDVHVLLQGLPSNPSPPGTANPLFFGTIVYPLGNIAEVLLNEGFAKVNDWTLGMLNGGEKYRIAERNAKLKKMRLWKDYVDKSTLNLEVSTFSALVIRILGPDLIQIENTKTGKEQKVQLSSVRGPKRQKNDAGLETGYYSEAVEFLRSRLVGKTVQVCIDYVKPAEGEYEARTCVTIMNGDQNIGEALISRGLAQVIRHRKDDENRSSKYDVLLIAEERAQSSGKGLWSPKDAPTIRISDVSESLAKAKQFLPFLQKSGEMGGIVEYCASGSRFRILVPSQSARITLVLGGIRVPRAGGGGSSKAEPFGPEALNFVNKHVLQRDVTFSAENVDKSGGIIGTLWVEKKNVAVSLLEQGFGYVHDYSASQSAYSTALYEAEAIAKNSRIGVWEDFDPNAAIDEISSSVETLLIDQKNVVVSEFTKDSLFIQVLGSEAKKLEKMMQSFSESYSSSNTPLSSPKVGDYCAAKFSADNQWYRAQIIGISGTRGTVRYIDYGNCETLQLSSLSKLMESHSIKTLPAQAIKVELAHLEFPTDDDDASFYKAQSLLGNSQFLAKMTDKSNVLLFPSGSKTSINEELLKTGHCFLKPSSVSLARETHKIKLKSGLGLELLGEKDDLTRLIEAQDEAKRDHLNIWRYGDFQDDD